MDALDNAWSAVLDMVVLAEKKVGLKTFFVEALSSFLLFAIFWIPTVSFAELGFDKLWGWGWHCFGMCFWDDWTTNTLGANLVNPVFVIVGGVTGTMKLKEAGARLTGEIVAGIFAFTIIKDCLGIPGKVANHPGMSGPKVDVAFQAGGPQAKTLGLPWQVQPALCECALAALMVIGFTLIPKLFTSKLMRRLLPAVVTRALIQAGSNISGGCFNPLVAFAWMAYNKSWTFDARRDYIFIYILAPLIGGVVGATTLTLALRVSSGKASLGRTRSSSSSSSDGGSRSRSRSRSSSKKRR